MMKVKVNKRDNHMYPYSISYMNREEVLLSSEELIDLYLQISDVMLDDDYLWMLVDFTV